MIGGWIMRKGLEIDFFGTLDGLEFLGSAANSSQEAL